MEFNVNITIISIVIYFIVIIINDTFKNLTWGRVRRIDDKDTSEYFVKLLNNSESHLITLRIFKAISFSIVVLQIFTLIQFQDISSVLTYSIFFLSIALIAVCANLIAKLISIKFDVFTLKFLFPCIRAFSNTLFSPIIFLVCKITDRIEELNNKDELSEKTTAEDEIMSLIEHASEENIDDSELEEDEKRMIRGVFGLDNTPVREIMTPRVDVDGLDITSSINDAIKLFIDTGRSRIPVYSKNIDDIKGVVFAKDFIDYERVAASSLAELAHKAIYIPETKLIDDLLEEIQTTGNHFSVVIDEYGGTSGIISLEDIIEEIVGEIKDEYDSEEDVESEPVATPDGSFLIDARTLIGDINDLLKSQLPEKEDVDTVGGYVCGELGRIPQSGEEFLFYDVKFTILKADNRKILTMKIS